MELFQFLEFFLLLFFNLPHGSTGLICSRIHNFTDHRTYLLVFVHVLA